MKKTLTLFVTLGAAMLLAGCTLPSMRKQPAVINVPVTTTSTGDAKQECLAKRYQWNDQTLKCERQQPQQMCLTAENQRNNKTEMCEYSKDNCLAAGLQWNEQDASCEYSKSDCLTMEAQWDEKTSKCEIMPHTTQQKINDCLDKSGQRDYEKSACEMMTGSSVQ
ncbi:hypothetical protein KBC03_06605 [Patescibacteria group bacterium]|nr:hypothetical protein [Patescibacteria group bacterium]